MIYLAEYMELSKTSYVILGMLRTRAHTGYEIKALVDDSTRFFWAASYGQIYPELKRLEEAGLVEGESVPQDGRRRRAYSLTAAGREALQELDHAPASRCTPRCATRGCCASSSPTWSTPTTSSSWCARCARCTSARGTRCSAIRPKAQEARDERGQEFPLRTLEFGIAYQDFVIDWCSQLERELAGESTKTGS